MTQTSTTAAPLIWTRGKDGVYRAESDADGGLMFVARKASSGWDLYVGRRVMLLADLPTFGHKVAEATCLDTLRDAKSIAAEFAAAPKGLCPMADAIRRAYGL